MAQPIIDLKGKRFGKLLVLKRSKKNKGDGQPAWVCRCRCGNVKRIRGSALRRGETKSCGCLRVEVGRDIGVRNIRPGHNRTHGMSRTRIYSVWRRIMGRCYNEKDTSFKDYGGRGIVVCKRWHTFENFREDMNKSYKAHKRIYPNNTTIDRIDNDGDYTPDNCRWTTYKVNRNNRVDHGIRKDQRLIMGKNLLTGEKRLFFNREGFARENGLGSRGGINYQLSGEAVKPYRGWKFKFSEVELENG